MSKNKALGWGAIPREIFKDDFENENQRIEWLEFNRKFLEKIINEGELPDFTNKSRLLLLNKKPGEIPTVENSRPI